MTAQKSDLNFYTIKVKSSLICCGDDAPKATAVWRADDRHRNLP